MIIKLWDNEGYNYPLIEIVDDYLVTFEKLLDQYRNLNEGEYNFDDFCRIIESKKFFIRYIQFDKEVFF